MVGGGGVRACGGVWLVGVCDLCVWDGGGGGYVVCVWSWL